MGKAFDIKALTMKFPEFNLGPIDLDLQPETVLAYIEPNGSGKTTTMQLFFYILLKPLNYSRCFICIIVR